MASIACVLFDWLLGAPSLEFNEKYRNIPVHIFTYSPFDSLMSSVYLLAVHRANLLITESIPFFSEMFVYTNVYLYSFPGELN